MLIEASAAISRLPEEDESRLFASGHYPFNYQRITR